VQIENTIPVAERDKSQENVLDIVSIFSGIKKKVFSKQFKGGEVVCIFGGAEINLTNADFTSPVTLEIVQIFGGTKLIVPSNWEIRSEATAIFGGIDDKRPQMTNVIAEKTIILQGTIMFGGVDVNSF
jgi:predicted membrane protein